MATSLSAAVVFISLLASTSTASSSRFLSAATAAATTNTEFIRTSCSATTYPKLCYSSLAVHASKIQTSARLLVSTALDVTLSSAKSTSASMVKLSRTHGISPREAAAMRDCAEEMADSVDQISRSIDEMAASKGAGSDFEMMISNVKTWVSAALTDESTCEDGFDGKEMAGVMKAVVRGKVETVAHLTSNALALINAYAAVRH
ncbi:unnamed protein product [Linum tenue]|uniref:Pectinesterase inhibitor domain-containing protein n=1 Tax=Linum tenue TaxID=586396 RepID=A0AAV0J5B4_9ROSI|nr:unnamed protein product [Linum tenue]